MKIYIVKLAQLALFFVIFAPGMVIGMETDVPKLPCDVNKLILTKVLRLVLDEVEDNRHQLYSRKKMNFYIPVYSRKKLNFFSGFLVKHVTGESLECYESANNIDYILTLIMAKTIGADPNTKSYKGNNILYLLASGSLQMKYPIEEDPEFKFLQMKIKILSKYNPDFNIKNRESQTIGHELVERYVGYGDELEIFDFIIFLQNLGMNLSIVKDNVGHTACDRGQDIFEQIKKSHADSDSVQVHLNEFSNIDKSNAILNQLKVKNNS